MDKKKETFVLIDGNSLLNRAFYAMTLFTTKDGMPTNGIFGFMKLIFKIIEDKQPTYFAVAFDVHAPTFRHNMYDDYKGTRRPMPAELVVQVPVLKDLLHKMNICTAELAGYEADDIIGTLTRRFDDVTIDIYTGDRDAYQLVRSGVNVCFTKRGVTDLDVLTAENFMEKVGLEPAQIVDEKALKGDTSDNIPGVRGIGAKSAADLLATYKTLDEIYAHIDEIKPAIRTRLIEHEADARLSYRLAAIDTNVPIRIEKEDCRLQLPFPVEARNRFVELEFRSLLDSPFFSLTVKREAAEVVVCENLDAFLEQAKRAGEFALALQKDSCHVNIGKTEYVFPIRDNFLGAGFFFGDLKPLFSTLFSGERLAVVTDLKGLLHRLNELGVEIGCRVEDVSLMRYLGDSNLRASDAADFVKDLNLPPDNLAYAVALAYGDATSLIKGTAEETLYRTVELPLERVLFDMEKTGVCVDVDKFPEFSEKFNRELASLSERIYDIAQMDPFNLNSPFQLSEVLFDKLGLDPHGAKKNVRGGYSTNAEVLERLAEEHEIARLILRYREIQKLQSTYIEGIRPLIAGGIVHTTYNQTMTTTGRLSSANPNLQNIPVRTDEGRELRKLFIAREGNLLVDADYTQIELRLLAHFSGCKALLDAYNAGEDIHSAAAARVFGVKRSEVTSAMRRRAKTINFGIIYGMSAFGLSKDLGCSASEAQTYIAKYFATYPEVKEYMDGNVRFAKENGYVTTILGRKRFIPELKSPNYNLRSFGERAAMNMPLQGSAADIIKIAMLHVASRLERDGSTARMVLQVHDELILDAPAAEEESAKRILKEEMENAISLRVPLTVDINSGKSWYDAK